jgi:hypothetical protein
MTTTAPSTTTSTAVVDRFIAGIEAGSVTADLYAETAVLDATVPGWRFRVEGPEAIAGEYGRWFGLASRMEELERHSLPGGVEVVRYLHSFTEEGERRAAHHCHLLTVVDGHITADTVFCGGRWPAAALAAMGLTVHAG